jgi:lipopolysaccharide transport system ATP-binding protein
MTTVIKVENLSKQYSIGSAQSGYKTFRETLVDAAKAPFQQLGRLFNRQSSIVNRQSEDTIWALRDISFEIKRGDVDGHHLFI